MSVVATNQQSVVKIDFRTGGLLSTVPPEVSLCLFRVLPEVSAIPKSAVEYASKRDHGGTPSEINLTVSDSGVGFQLEGARIMMPCLTSASKVRNYRRAFPPTPIRWQLLPEPLSKFDQNSLAVLAINPGTDETKDSLAMEHVHDQGKTQRLSQVSSRLFLPLRPLPGGRRLAAARTGVSDCAGFAPN